MGMKCIRCGTDNDLRDRTTHYGRCKRCNHLFTFEPSTVQDLAIRFTDPFFAKAINDISANNSLFFTPKQLSYFLDRRLKFQNTKRSYGWLFLYLFFNIWSLGFIGGFLSILIGNAAFIIVPFLTNIAFVFVLFKSSSSSRLSYQARKASARNLQIVGGLILSVGAFFGLLILTSFNIFTLSVLLGMLSIFLGTRQRMRQAGMTEEFLFERNQFRVWVNRWVEVNGSIPRMLPSPREENNPVVVNPDVSAYSFDRVVVCDSAAIAQLLIANNFHFENNCAVLSITGYPQSIFATVMEMLWRNPDLKVYALHDASPRGVSLVHNLRTSPQWFQNSNVAIFDLGLSPRQILASRNMFVRASDVSARESCQLPDGVRQGLTQDERKWLDEGKFVELESFTPQRIIRVLHQGIAQSQNPQSSDSLVLLDDRIYDSGGYVFVTDSFG